MIEIIKNTKIDFIGMRKKAFALSAFLVLLGIFAFVMISLGRANLSVDFTGGTSLQIRFKGPMTTATLRQALIDGGITDVQIQEISGTNDFFIKTKLFDRENEKVQDKISSILSSTLKATEFEIMSSNMVGGGVGRALKRQALIAIFLALLGIIIYIAWRFDFVSGVAATIATFHDVLTMLGIFYIMNKEMNLLIITALLTIAGYSLQDTVVVYDRIRENMAKMRAKDDLAGVINLSINEVLSRTVITGLTTLLTLLTLMLMGGEVLFNFALALFIGVIIGTYSSIFVASQLVYIWRKR